MQIKSNCKAKDPFQPNDRGIFIVGILIDNYIKDLQIMGSDFN